MELRLTDLLLSGTERHGTPRSLQSWKDSGGFRPRAGRAWSGGVERPALRAGSRRTSVLDRPMARPEGLALAEGSRGRLPHLSAAEGGCPTFRRERSSLERLTLGWRTV